MTKQIIARKTILMFLANISLYLSALILLPIITKSVPVADYGLWVQFNVSINLLPLIIVLGLPSYAMIRYLASETNEKEIQNGFYSIMFFVTFLSLIAALLIISLSEPIANLLFNKEIIIVQILSVIVVFISLNMVFFNYFITFQQIRKYATITILKALLTLIIVSFLIFNNESLFYAIFGLLLTEIIIFPLAFMTIFRQIGIVWPKFTRIKKYLKLSLPTIPASISYWIIDSSDRYILGIIIGTSAVGYYSPAYTLGSILILFIAPISSLLTSLLSKNYDNDKIGVVNCLINYSFKYYVIIGIPSIVGLSIFSKLILTILSTSEIASTSYFITPLIAISFFLLGISMIFSNAIILKKETRVIAWAWLIGAMTNIIINIILITKIGILGAAISTLVAYSVSLCIILHASKYYSELKVNFSIIIKAIISSIPILIIYYICRPKVTSDIIIFIILSTIIYIIFLFALKGFTTEEIKSIRQLFFKTST